MAERPVLTSLTEAQRAHALARFVLLRPALEEGVPLAQVARAQGLQVRTARRWVHQYRQQGLAGLVRKPRADAGRRTWPRPLHLLIEGLALRRPPPTAAAIHRQVTAIAQQQGWPVPSYSSVYALIQQLDPALVTLAHEGTTVYQDTFDLLYRREASQPNEIWQADHTPLDLWVRDDAGRPARPWLSVMLGGNFRLVQRLFSQIERILQINQLRTISISRRRVALWEACNLFTLVLHSWARVKPVRLTHILMLLERHGRATGLW